MKDSEIHSRSLLISAKEISKVMEISPTTAYKIVRELNEQLEKMGYLTVTGKTSKVFFYEKIYGGDRVNA